MQSSFLPVSELSGDEIVEYFSRRGYSPETVKWKYFEGNFCHGRERGYGWMHHGKLRGFVGLIPFAAARGAERVETAWTCDWSVEEPGIKGGIGVMLMWQTFRSYAVLFGLGGNARSRSLFPKMAARTIEGAGVALYMPLRLGAALGVLRRFLPSLRPESWEALGRIPVRWIAKHPKAALAKVEADVSPALDPLLERANPGGSWFPRYDSEYVRWQLCQCPDLESFTVYIPSEGGARAAALCWHARESTSYWRMALLAEPGAKEETRAVLSRTAHHVYSSGGQLLAALVSKGDTATIRVLRKAGFLAAGNRRALYALGGKQRPLPLDELRQLSYLDTDLAHFL